MTNTKDDIVTDVLAPVQAAWALNPMIAPQVRQFWQVQQDMLERAETFGQEWCARRHEAVETTVDTINTMVGDGDTTEKLQAFSEFYGQAIRHASEDFYGAFALGTLCANDITRAEIMAEQEGIEKTAEQISSTKRKHATPV